VSAIVKELPVGKKELRRRADGLSLLRAGLIAVVMLVAHLLEPVASGTEQPYAKHPLLFNIVLGAYLALVLLSMMSHGRVKALERLLYSEICLDVIVTSFVVRWTGGVDSIFVFLYVVAIVSTSLLLSAGGGFAVASLASLTFTGALFAGWQAGPWEFSETPRWLAAVSFFYLTAFLAGFLSAGVERLRVFSASLLQNLVSGVAIVDLEGGAVFLNPAAREILGLTGREKNLRAQTLFSTPSGENPVVACLTDGTSRQRQQLDVLRQDGTTVPMGLTVSILKGRHGSLRGAVVSFADLTDVRRLEREVRLRDRIAALGTMSAGLAHEIRNPLASLSGSAELLEDSQDLKGDGRRLLGVILRETTRLNQIVTAFLEYSRQELPQRERVELRPLLEEVVASVEGSDDWTATHRAETSYLDGGPAVRGDAVQLRQCFLNLARNAAQAMRGGGTVRLAVHAATNDHVEVDVIDEGEGMADDQLSRIFDPFYSTREGGTGLGLSVVHRIVEAHGGTIRVESRPGEGTAFHVRLPAAAS
jgi:two-component system sensor histidine kinase PilS (NtrC family)